MTQINMPVVLSDTINGVFRDIYAIHPRRGQIRVGTVTMLPSLTRDTQAYSVQLLQHEPITCHSLRSVVDHINSHMQAIAETVNVSALFYSTNDWEDSQINMSQY